MLILYTQPYVKEPWSFNFNAKLNESKECTANSSVDAFINERETNKMAEHIWHECFDWSFCCTANIAALSLINLSTEKNALRKGRHKWSRFAYLTWVLHLDCDFWNGFLAWAVSRFGAATAFGAAVAAAPTFGKFIWFSSFPFFFLRWRTRLRFEPVEPMVSLVADSNKSSLRPMAIELVFRGETNSVASLTFVREWEWTFCSVNTPSVSDADSLPSFFGVTLYKEMKKKMASGKWNKKANQRAKNSLKNLLDDVTAFDDADVFLGWNENAD